MGPLFDNMTSPYILTRIMQRFDGYGALGAALV